MPAFVVLLSFYPVDVSKDGDYGITDLRLGTKQDGFGGKRGKDEESGLISALYFILVMRR